MLFLHNCMLFFVVYSPDGTGEMRVCVDVFYERVLVLIIRCVRCVLAEMRACLISAV